MVELRPVELGDAEYLAANLRAQDRAELIACGVSDFASAIASSASTGWARTALVDGQIACMTGVAPGGTPAAPFGVPWLLGTDLVRLHGRALARHARAYIPPMLRVYPRLINRVHADNTVAVQWLIQTGFSLRPAEPHPVTGALFHLFEMHA